MPCVPQNSTICTICTIVQFVQFVQSYKYDHYIAYILKLCLKKKVQKNPSETKVMTVLKKGSNFIII